MQTAATLAIVGGAGMCFLVLYSTVYLSLHYHAGLNFKAPLQFGDLLAFASGAVAIAIGVITLQQRPGSTKARGMILAFAGAPTTILLLLWSFPETFHLTVYPEPFYFGFVYLGTLARIHVGSGSVPAPLLVASAAVVVGGAMMWTALTRTD